MEANTFGCYRRCTLTGPLKKIKKGIKKSTWKAELEARLIGKRLKIIAGSVRTLLSLKSLSRAFFTTSEDIPPHRAVVIFRTPRWRFIVKCWKKVCGLVISEFLKSRVG